jgi:hypothetical protein
MEKYDFSVGGHPYVKFDHIGAPRNCFFQRRYRIFMNVCCCPSMAHIDKFIHIRLIIILKALSFTTPRVPLFNYFTINNKNWQANV